MEEAGTMEELEELIAACEKREIVVMMDLVLNHSSHLHPWFLEARKDRNSKYHDFYIWKEGTKEQPPEEMCIRDRSIPHKMNHQKSWNVTKDEIPKYQ